MKKIISIGKHSHAKGGKKIVSCKIAFFWRLLENSLHIYFILDKAIVV